MQPWHIKALELEATALKHLHEFIHEHADYVLIGMVYLVMTLGIGLILLLSKSLKGKSVHVRPVIFIELPGPPPPPQDTFDPFPPYREPDYYDHDDYPLD